MSADNCSRNSPLEPSSDDNVRIRLEGDEHEVLQKDEHVEQNKVIASTWLTTKLVGPKSLLKEATSPVRIRTSWEQPKWVSGLPA